MSTVPPPSAVSSEDRNWAVVAHLSGLLFYCTPFGNVILPLVLWQVFKDKSPHVGREAREALNFQITFTLAAMVAGLLCLVLIGFLLGPVLALAQVALTIIAAVKASEGSPFRYPLTLRLVTESEPVVVSVSPLDETVPSRPPPSPSDVPPTA